MDRQRVSYDVAVVGGGAAGLAAALGAARFGARTALVERYGFLGGMATAGMVSSICGLYRTAASGDAELLNPGVGEEIAARLGRMSGGSGPVRRGRTWVLPYSPFALACLADELTTSSPELDVYLHAYLVDAGVGARRIETLRIATWERTVEVAARAVVDASGDAVVAHRTGAATVAPPVPERQLQSLVFVLQDVDAESLDQGARVALVRSLIAAEREGRLPKGASNLALAPSTHPGEVVCKLTLGGIAPGADGGPRLSDGCRAGRSTPRARRHRVPENDAGVRAGLHLSRRAAGGYPRESARGRALRAHAGGRPERSHVRGRRRPRELAHRALGGGPARRDVRVSPRWRPTIEIPLGASSARDVDNLFVAGRAMSASHKALGSARVDRHVPRHR